MNSNCESFVNVVQPIDNHHCPSATFNILNDFNNSNNASDIFPLGETDILFTLTNLQGLTSTCSKKVVVIDTVKPDIFCQNDTIIHVDNISCSVVFNYVNPIVNDSCGFSLSILQNNSNILNNTLQVGTHIFEFTATDISMNSRSCSVNVQVLDTIKPVIVCDDTIKVFNTVNSCDTLLNIISPIPTDNCSIASLINSYNFSADASGFYDVDTTNVVWTAEDINGNDSSCTQVIIVIDTISPFFVDKPSDTLIYSKANECGVSYDYITEFVLDDNCAVDNLTKLSPVGFNGGDTLGLGVEMFSFELVDQNSNNSIYNYTVTVQDSFQLELICPSDTVICGDVLYYRNYEIVSPCHIEQSYTHLNGPLSGAIVNEGIYNILYEVSDQRGQTAQCDFNVELYNIPEVSVMNDTVLCENQESFEISANEVGLFELGLWSSNNLSLSFDNASDSITNVNNLQSGLNQLVWEISNPQCSVSDTLNIIVDSLPGLKNDTIILSEKGAPIVIDMGAFNYLFFME